MMVLINFIKHHLYQTHYDNNFNGGGGGGGGSAVLAVIVELGGSSYAKMVAVWCGGGADGWR